MDFRKIFSQQELNSLSAIYVNGGMSEESLVQNVECYFKETPSILINTHLSRTLKKKIFGSHQHMAFKLYKHIKISKNLFFEMKSIIKKMNIVLSKNKLIQIIKLSKLKKQLLSDIKDYNKEIEFLKTEFHKLSDELFRFTQDNVKDLQKELPFVRINQTIESLHAFAMLPEIKEEYSAHYDKTVKLLSKLYLHSIPLEDFVKFMHHLRHSNAQKIFRQSSVKLRHIYYKENFISPDDFPLKLLLNPEFSDFIGAFANVFDKYNNLLDSIIQKQGVDHETWRLFSVLVKHNFNKNHRLIHVLKKMSAKKLFLEYRSPNFTKYAFGLLTNILDEELIDLITDCGIHKIHNETESEIVKQLKVVYESHHFSSISHIAKTFKKTIDNSFQHITTLYYFIKIASVRGLDFFEHKMDFSDLKDLAFLPSSKLEQVHSRKNICAIITSEDHNGAFARTINVLNDLPRELFKVNFGFFGSRGNRQKMKTHDQDKRLIYFKRVNKRPLKKMVHMIKQTGTIEKIDYLFIAAHGEPTIIDAFNLHLERTAVHSSLFRSIDKYLAKNAIIILLSCSTGKFVNGQKPVAKEIAEALRRKVIAPTEDSNSEGIQYDNQGNITGIDYGHHGLTNVAARVFR